MLNFGCLLGWQGQFEKAQGIPYSALEHQFRLQGLEDDGRGGRTAAEKDLCHHRIVLMLKEINRRPQFPAQRGHKRFKM